MVVLIASYTLLTTRCDVIPAFTLLKIEAVRNRVKNKTKVMVICILNGVENAVLYHNLQQTFIIFAIFVPLLHILKNSGPNNEVIKNIGKMSRFLPLFRKIKLNFCFI
jgi:hypothetical protein